MSHISQFKIVINGKLLWYKKDKICHGMLLRENKPVHLLSASNHPNKSVLFLTYYLILLIIHKITIRFHLIHKAADGVIWHLLENFLSMLLCPGFGGNSECVFFLPSGNDGLPV